MAVIKNMDINVRGEQGAPHSDGGIVKWCCYRGEEPGSSSKGYPYSLLVTQGFHMQMLCPHKNVYADVHSCVLDNGQKAETTQMPIH